MKLTSIGLYSNDVEKAIFSFRDPNSTNPYCVVDIDGLAGEDIVPKIYAKNITTGKSWYNLTLSKRVLVIDIILNPNFSSGESYSDLRDNLYKTIASSRDGMVELRFNDLIETLAILKGFVVKFDSNLMSKTPKVTLTIRCDESVLKSPTEHDAVFQGETTEYFTYAVNTFSVIDDKSTSPHGFTFGISFSADSSFFIMQEGSLNDRGYFSITPGLIDGETGFVSGDQLIVSSNLNDRYVVLIRDSESIYLADKLDPGSVWPMMFPGQTFFMCQTDLGFTWDYFKYYPTYWGV